MTSKEILNIIREDEELEFFRTEVYAKIFGNDSVALSIQQGRWISLYLLLKKLEEMEYSNNE